MVDSSTSALSNLVASRLFTNLLTITIDSLSLKLSKTQLSDRSLFASIVKALCQLVDDRYVELTKISRN